MRQYRTDEQLLAEEVALEKEMMGLGQVRYAKLRERGEEATRPGRVAIRLLIDPLAQAVAEWVAEGLAGKAGPQGPLAQFLSQLPAEDIAFATARWAIHLSAQPHATFVAACGALGRALANTALAEALRAADPKAYDRLITKIERAPWPSKRHVLMRRAGEKAKLKTINWDSHVTPAKVGAILFMLLERSSGGLVRIVPVPNGVKTTNRIVLDDAFQERLEKAHAVEALLGASHLPMVVPPRPWTSPFHGGYLDRRGLPLRLINAARVNRNYLSELKFREMPMVYKAINAIQATPWRINLPVYEALKQVWERELPLGGIPQRGLLPLPEAPWGAGEPPSEEARKAHIAALARTHDANHKLGSKRRAVVQKLWVAERYATFERLYFPHMLDFRGRVYPVGSAVNPQADDSGRALLEFADGVALGDGGAYWLAVHGANSYGVDKVAYDARAAWVTEHTDEILACAADPLANRFWSDADSPFTFYAFCVEWKRLNDWANNGGAVEEFVSHLPVSWDGSCNGLQNFSAMLRDPAGGAATNLLPTDKPNDIYQQVADVAARQVEQDAARGEVNARYWLGKVTRQIAKRPTMTLPYGSGRYGFRQQLIEWMDAYKLDHGKQYLDGGDPFLCSVYLANVLHDALGQVVVAARTAMDWLKEVSRVAARDGLPVTWTTPAGFLVMQDYRMLEGRRVQMLVDGRKLQLLLQIEGETIDPRRQAQGIAPNYVHSLDAAHLMRTVAMAHDRGMLSFAMVHDSYGTHAGNAGALHVILREAFVEQYSGDVLGQFLRDIAERLPPELVAKLPPPPPQGSLDLGSVRNSDYFFA